ncbi:MAG TPA: hypothetical protein PLA65_16970 [Spirochaetota bacterium]|nr:hypothetical protein [Spirochaetota bacterium]HOD15303.1 hypothetical protein [Spirochaetota bacterium]HPG52525.1 hypothetical protein [Spirochaetota bacterium]HPN13752.1 hypothetical protein [Spirochaetota bacterium]
MLGRKTTTSSETKAAPFKNSRKIKDEATFQTARFQDEIQVQAYYNYLKRMKNNLPGSPEADWLEAEQSVIIKMKAH